MFILGFIVLALLFGYLQGGSIGANSQIRLRYGVLVVAALAIQIVLSLWGPSPNIVLEKVGAAVNAVSYLCIVIFMHANRRIAGSRVVSAGLSINLLAIVANGGYMPSATALAGVDTAALGASPSLVGSALWYLGDVLSMPQAIPFAEAFSIGDVLVGLGIFVALREMMQPVRTDIQLVRQRYQPKHLAISNKQYSSTRRAG